MSLLDLPVRRRHGEQRDTHCLVSLLSAAMLTEVHLEGRAGGWLERRPAGCGAPGRALGSEISIAGRFSHRRCRLDRGLEPDLGTTGDHRFGGKGDRTLHDHCRATCTSSGRWTPPAADLSPRGAATRLARLVGVARAAG